MVNYFVVGYFYVVIGDGQCMFVFIERDMNVQFVIIFVQVWVRECMEMQFVCCIGGVRDKFMQEDFFIGIERMDYQVQKLFYF